MTSLIGSKLQDVPGDVQTTLGPSVHRNTAVFSSLDTSLFRSMIGLSLIGLLSILLPVLEAILGGGHTDIVTVYITLIAVFAIYKWIMVEYSSNEDYRYVAKSINSLPLSASPYIGKFGSTVHKRRQKAVKRMKKLKNNHTELVRRLRVIFDLQAPKSWRESLAVGLVKLATKLSPYRNRSPCFRTTSFRAADWILRGYFAHLPLEKNMIRSDPYRNPSYKRISDLVAKSAMLDLLEREDLGVTQRILALEMFREVIVSSRAVEGTGERIIRFCLHRIYRHYTNEPLSHLEWKRLLAVLNYAYGARLGGNLFPSPIIDEIIDHEFVLPFLFDGMRVDEEDVRFLSIYVFGHLIRSTHQLPSLRVSIVVRHFTTLQEIFPLLELKRINGIIHVTEFAAIFVVTPFMLERCDIVHKFPSDLPDGAFDKKMSAVSSVLNLLKCALAIDNSSLLDRLLSRGYLTVSRIYSRNGFINRHDLRHFQSILDRYPEWISHFKKWTSDGEVGNAIADHGWTLPDPRKITNWYIFNESDEEN